MRFTTPDLGIQWPVISEDFKLLNLLILFSSSLFAANLNPLVSSEYEHVSQYVSQSFCSALIVEQLLKYELRRMNSIQLSTSVYPKHLIDLYLGVSTFGTLLISVPIRYERNAFDPGWIQP
jgi:hypothetical protein